jgi:hypothetical protein
MAWVHHLTEEARRALHEEGVRLPLLGGKGSADHGPSLALAGKQHIGGSGGSLEPPGPLLETPGPRLTHLHTVYIAYSVCLPTRLNPLAERTCFS